MSELNVVEAVEVPVVETPVETPVARRGRGRPAVYSGLLLTHIMDLVTQLGLTNARKVLNANGAVLNAMEKKFGVKRDRTVAPKGLGISMVTLCHYGQKHGIQLKRGRPKTVKAAA